MNGSFGMPKLEDSSKIEPLNFNFDRLFFYAKVTFPTKNITL